MKVMRIQKLREDAELTQTQLATRMGLSQSVISSWESEVYLPKARQLPLLSKVLGCEIKDLYSESESELGEEE